MSGTITLYYKGKPVRVRRYDRPWIRRKILEEWKRDYGNQYPEMYYQIAPDLNEIKLTA